MSSGTWNYVLYWIHKGRLSDSVCHNRVQVLSIPVVLHACSQDWTCNQQMIVSLEAKGTKAITITPWVQQVTPPGSIKGCSLKFREGSRVRQTSEEGRRTYRPKRCGNNNKDEDNIPKTLGDKNQQALSQKFRQNKISSRKVEISRSSWQEVEATHAG